MRKLYFKEKFFKITDHYPILDENGREAYYLDQDFTFIGYKSSVSSLDGREVFRIDRQIISLLPRYDVDFADGGHMVIQSKIALFGKKIDVYMDNETLNLKGNIWSLNFDIYNGNGKQIGALNKKLFTLTDSFELTIIDPAYEHELIALVICVNNLLDMEQRRRANNANNN